MHRSVAAACITCAAPRPDSIVRHTPPSPECRVIRPTIPLADWRIATDLEATRTLGAAGPPPPCGWTCPWCRNWAVAHAGLLGATLVTELRRLGIDPARPADLYPYAEPEGGAQEAVPQRAIFHAVGRILGGPPATDEASFGTVRRYTPLGDPAAPLWPELSVAYVRDVDRPRPWHAVVAGSLLQIDFRVPVPWALAEPRPPVFADGSPLRGV